MAQYAVIRTNKDAREYIWSEFLANRLRQGWGRTLEQDLGRIHAKRQSGDPLTAEEQQAVRHMRMLGEAWKGLQVGDVVVVPNLPDQGRWVIARVGGPYRFDIDESQGDYGHILPVHPVRKRDGTIAAINPSDALVDARLRGTMRTMSRMWSIDYLGSAIEFMIEAIESGADLSSGQTREARRQGFLAGVRAELSQVVWRVD